jgi:hypothetical protein
MSGRLYFPVSETLKITEGESTPSALANAAVMRARVARIHAFLVCFQTSKAKRGCVALGLSKSDVSDLSFNKERNSDKPSCYGALI